MTLGSIRFSLSIRFDFIDKVSQCFCFDANLESESRSCVIVEARKFKPCNVAKCAIFILLQQIAKLVFTCILSSLTCYYEARIISL